jgi:hypothetical protein
MKHAIRVLLLAAGAFLALVPGVRAQPDKCGQMDVGGRPASGVIATADGVTVAATVVEDLVLHVKLKKSLAGEHVLRLDFYLPEGDLYQSVSVPVSLGDKGAKASSRAEPRRVAGYPFPLPTKVAQPIVSGKDADKQTLDVALPIAGTAIVSNSLYGSWAVDLTLDDAAQPCAPRVTFGMQP